MSLREEDLEMIAGCDAAHPDRRGGQHVAMQCTGVRILHRPSGLAVTCIRERSQIKNKQIALSALEVLIDLIAD